MEKEILSITNEILKLDVFNLYIYLFKQIHHYDQHRPTMSDMSTKKIGSITAPDSAFSN